ncbi:hypothetical protein HaLaN_05765 [Haematococcus lacustris]|uniref:Uncharacterized protein n=1 Tax=Haematococcus lacustris TaxID=44745 RepID=A0A699YK64_HAELA|nr:hypothetical protein HaLaN_05765 [Haematococcus lacustris]
MAITHIEVQLGQTLEQSAHCSRLITNQDDGIGEGQLACPRLEHCDNLGREQLVAALPAQLDAQGWDVQQGGWSNKAVRL